MLVVDWNFGRSAKIASFRILCYILLVIPAVAGIAPWFNNVRQTEQLVWATSADDPVLRDRLLRLSRSVRPDEARGVVHCAYTTGQELRREWRVAWMAGVQNFLVNTGARKGGLCFQWANELLKRLNAQKLQTLDLHWAESFAGTSGEHNVIVVTAKGQPMAEGIILDNWRYVGHLVYCRAAADPEYRWIENPGEFVRRLEANSATIIQPKPAGGAGRRPPP